MKKCTKHKTKSTLKIFLLSLKRNTKGFSIIKLHFVILFRILKILFFLAFSGYHKLVWEILAIFFQWKSHWFGNSYETGDTLMKFIICSTILNCENFHWPIFVFKFDAFFQLGLLIFYFCGKSQVLTLDDGIYLSKIIIKYMRTFFDHCC